MAHNHFSNGMHQNRRTANQISQNNYDYELKKLMEQERRVAAAQVGTRRKYLLKYF